MKRNINFFVVLVPVFAVLIANTPLAVAVDRTPAESAGVGELLTRLAKKVSAFSTLKTDFTQEKELALFEDKIVLKGRIYLAKPNKVAWHVDHPVRYSVLITDKMIRQWDAETNKVQELSLSGNPVFQNVLGQLTIWFAGDYSSLLKDHDVRIVQTAPIIIECSPKRNTITSKVIKSITLTFRDDESYLQQIRIHERNGDSTTIAFRNTVLNPPLDSGSFEVQPGKQKSSLTTGTERVAAGDFENGVAGNV